MNKSKLITQVNAPDFVNYYVKNPVPIMAIQMHDEFFVETEHGPVRGKPGDYLLKGVKGELYPCDQETFKGTYRKYEVVQNREVVFGLYKDKKTGNMYHLFDTMDNKTTNTVLLVFCPVVKQSDEKTKFSYWQRNAFTRNQCREFDDFFQEFDKVAE